MSNFSAGITALGRSARISLLSMFYNKTLVWFFVGMFLTILITMFVLTKHPANIPIILRHDSMESFQKISERDEHGTYQQGFTSFMKMYTQVRTLALVAFISFCVMVTTIMLK